ncbi:MAG: glycosyltransferase family 4 protein, partial [Bifidobacteriaceae bacterium]|nr:glycosyltransferase family 4 protein [Bifidobacteriaceae bacterium]
MGKTLVVTNDFPPRLGGIETFVYELTRRLPPERLVVLTASMPGAAAFDAGLAFPVHRLAASTLLPTPAVARTARELIDLHRCDSVWFGAAATLGLLAPTLRSHPGVRRVVASTHGHERTWARVPAGRPVLRRIAGAVDCLTYISDAVLGTLRRALPPKPPRLVRLTPGVDLDAFASRTRAPGPPGSAPIGANPDALRTRLGVPSGPLVVCVSRLVALKGQDVLLRAWPSVVGGCPDATLLLVGKGPRRRALEAQVRRLGIERSVRFAGGLPFAAIPDVYAAADVAVLLTRPVAAGLVEEGLGAVTLEASASGLPVVVGRTGGAVETVQDGRTGFLVDPRDAGEVADRIGW